MAVNIFISFRASDGMKYKDKLDNIFDETMIVRNYSENEDRSNMSEATIQDYLYRKLRETTLTIVILTPNAVEYKRDIFGDIDDWMYDEVRYSLEDRFDNRTNAVLALYTDEAKLDLFTTVNHNCIICNKESEIITIKRFNNLVRHNIMNIKPFYKHNKCIEVFSLINDSYIPFVSFNDFEVNPKKYIDAALENRNHINEFAIVKRIND